MEALSVNPCGMGTYQPPCLPLREGRNLFIKGNTPPHNPPPINPARVTKELPNRPFITHYREAIDLSTHPLARNFDVKEHTIDPVDFRWSNKPNIEVFRRILDAADLFGCNILEICALNTSKQPALEMVKCIIQKLKTNPQFEVRLDKTDFKYFKKVFLKKEGYHPKQLLVDIVPMGKWDDYICKFNHDFDASTRSISQTRRVLLKGPIAPSIKQTLTPQLSLPRSIPKTTPKSSRAAQKSPSSPMREPARALPQVNHTPNSSNAPQVSIRAPLTDTKNLNQSSQNSTSTFQFTQTAIDLTSYIKNPNIEVLSNLLRRYLTVPAYINMDKISEQEADVIRDMLLDNPRFEFRFKEDQDLYNILLSFRKAHYEGDQILNFQEAYDGSKQFYICKLKQLPLTPQPQIYHDPTLHLIKPTDQVVGGYFNAEKPLFYCLPKFAEEIRLNGYKYSEYDKQGNKKQIQLLPSQVKVITRLEAVKLKEMGDNHFNSLNKD